ncbi:MAG TPA: DUF2750 domain-containing protein [Kofleriaceae bacterium]|jgi:hypothetical protein
MWYVVLDCYPALDSPLFASDSCAYAGCWIVESRAADEATATQIARDKLERDARWITVARVSIEQVDVTHYTPDHPKRRFFEQALTDGFVCQVHIVARKYLRGHGAPSAALRSLFEAAVQQIAAHGAFTYRGSEGEQAVGALDEGDHFFPLWATRDDAVACADEWPECTIVPVSRGELVHEYLLEMHARELSLALDLDLDDTTIALFHPLVLRDQLLVTRDR